MNKDAKHSQQNTNEPNSALHLKDHICHEKRDLSLRKKDASTHRGQ